MRIAITGARGALGSALLPLLAGRELRLIDRRDGAELNDRDALRALLRGCDAIAHLAALHPLVAPADATYETYWDANVVPFEILLAVASESGARRVLLASSTSVWRDAEPGEPARFLDETVPPDADTPYARSKRACESLLAATEVEGVVLRLARFACPGDPADEVRKLYRAVDVSDAARAVALALDRAPPGSTFAISAPTPFIREDSSLLASDPATAIRRRTGWTPPWTPERIGGVVVSSHAERSLGWRARHPSALLRGPGTGAA